MTEINVPAKASAVVIGGGVTGASVAYHLARAGWNDVVLLERKQFACGTSWHAAGLIGTMGATGPKGSSFMIMASSGTSFSTVGA